ncbi:MAG: SDR family NAD(P)-dependent oxidoreductase [Chthoniobacteraceae bacterium]
MKNGTRPSGRRLAPARNGSAAASRNGRGHVLITGGSGFIGANLAQRLLADGERVLLYDNLSRAGVEQNFAWLREEFGDRVRLQQADTRDESSLRDAVQSATAVYHFAAQVAVTTSIEAPAQDFAVNAGGTLYLLEALRAHCNPPPLFFTSTNKVYGALSDVPLRVSGERYEPVDVRIRARGIDENQRLDFYSPYGCSKGTADQYILDYARTFGLPAVVFRMSCVYGPRQLGTEDQGWVAHFLIRALERRGITLFGDGRQVRDVLWVGDLVEAFLLARSRVSEISGNAFNIGGGVANTTSLLELVDLIAELEGVRPSIDWARWRLGDQRFYVSDTAKFRAATGWAPRVGVAEGVGRLHEWLATTRRGHALAPQIA